MLGIWVGKLPLNVAERELLQDLRRRIDAAGSKTAEGLRGQERAGNADHPGYPEADHAAASIGKVGNEWIVHLGEGGRALPAHHQVAVVPWSGEETKTSADDLFVVVERISEAQPGLNVAVVGGVKLASHAHVSSRGKDIEVVTKTSGDGKIGRHLPLILCVKIRQPVPELQAGCIDKCRGSTAGVEGSGKRQRARGELLPEVRAWLKKEELDRSARTEGRPGKLTRSKEALRCEDGRAGTEECSVRRDPYRFEAAAEFDRMRPAGVSEVFLGFELRLLVIRNAASEAATHQSVGNVQGWLIARSFGSEVKDAIPIGEDAL